MSEPITSIDRIRAGLDAFDMEPGPEYAIRAVLDLIDHGGTRGVAEWVSGPVLLAAIADALGLE